MELFKVITPDYGVYKRILKVGRTQLKPQDDLVTITYKGILENGTVFDQDVEKDVKLNGELIRGLEVGIKSMKIHEKAIFVLRHDYGFGVQGYEAIPPRACLIFEVELNAAKNSFIYIK